MNTELRVKVHGCARAVLDGELTDRGAILALVGSDKHEDGLYDRRQILSIISCCTLFWDSRCHLAA